MKKLLILSLAILMVVGLSGAAIAAPLITGFGFDTGGSSYENDITLPLNGTVSIDLYAIFSGIPETGGDSYLLNGFDFELGFEPTQLQLLTGTDVDANWDSFRNLVIDNTAGTVTMGGSALLSGVSQPTDALLATLVFECVALGTSDITLTSLNQAGGGPSGSADFVFNPTFESATFDGVVGSISNVPIPGSILLLGSGILGLVGLSRRKRS